MRRVIATAALIGISGTASAYCYQLIDANGALVYSEPTPPYSLAWPAAPDPAREASRSMGERLIITPWVSCPSVATETDPSLIERAAAERERTSLQHRAPTRPVTRQVEATEPTAPRTQQAHGNQLPRFDTQSYCQSVSAAGGGSYSIMQGCLRMEERARQDLANIRIEPQILRYCTDVGRVVGGSYSTMHGCVQMEMRAKREIGQ